MSVIDMRGRFAAAQAESAEDDEAFWHEYRRDRAIDDATLRLIGRLERKGYPLLVVLDRIQGMASEMIQLARDGWEKSAL
jgi:hypothetical protein